METNIKDILVSFRDAGINSISVRDTETNSVFKITNLSEMKAVNKANGKKVEIKEESVARVKKKHYKAKTKKSKPGVKKGIDWDSQPLGKKPDSVIAKEVGVTGPVVWAARTRRGIPAYKKP